MAAKQYRQGDVFLIAIDEIPTDVREVERDNGRVVLAYGEVTGHAHAILDRDVTLWEQADVDARFLEIVGDEPAQLLHEEHSTIPVPQVTNSTPEPTGEFHDFWLRVPPNIGTAPGAVAWTFGLDARSYRPLVQS